MSKTSLSRQAIERAVKDQNLCPNRIWQVSVRLEEWIHELQRFLIDANVPFKQALQDQDHSVCTFDFGEYSSRNFTAVKQRHELESCEDFCYRLCGLFQQEQLVKALEYGPNLTAWSLNGRQILAHPAPFMAVSHVWSDGTGNGAWSSGEVNSCLYGYFGEVARMFGCEGIWWDTLCIPTKRGAREEALNMMQTNYEYARITLVHDCFLRALKFTSAEMACFSIVISPWFSRGWTALELSKSRKVKIVFKDGIKDLDECILAKVSPENISAKVITNLRRPITTVNELLTVLGPRYTSWDKDKVNIAGLLVGVDISATPQGKTSSQSDTFQQVISQSILIRMGRVSHGHLFHKSATMSAGFSWCATKLFGLPRTLSETKHLDINDVGELHGEWHAVNIDDIPSNAIVWGSSHEMIEFKSRIALEDKGRHVLLVEPGDSLIRRAVIVQLMRKPTTQKERDSVDVEPEIKAQFISSIWFHPPFLTQHLTVHITIGDTEKWDNLGLEENAWKILEGNHAGQRCEISAPSDQCLRKGRLHKLPFSENPLWTALHDAAWRCDIALTRDTLLLPGFDVNRRGYLGRTALHLAAERGNEDILNCLLLHGANPLLAEERGQTTLHYAVISGSEKVVNRLLRTPNCQDLMRSVDSSGLSALHYAAWLNDSSLVKSLLSYGADPNIPCNYGCTALHLSATVKSNEVIAILLQGIGESIANPRIKNKNGRTALREATESGNEEAVVQLLAHNQLYEEEAWLGGSEALFVAALGGCMEIMDIFLHGFARTGDVFAKSPKEESLLHFAALGGGVAVVEFCLQRGIDIESKTKEGYTALHLAAKKGNVGVVKRLLDAGADKEAQDPREQTALHLAVQFRHSLTAWTLIEMGANKEAVAGCRYTALHIAAFHNDATTVEALIATGVEKEARGGRMSGISGEEYTALHLAALKGFLPTVRVLLEKGANVDARTSSAFTPLHCAVRSTSIETVHLLLDSGAQRDIGNSAAASNLRTTMGNCGTALHEAVRSKNLQMVQVLVERGLNKEAKNNFGYTPLLVAAVLNDVAMIKTLISLEADLKARCLLGLTAFHLAAKEGHTEALMALSETNLQNINALGPHNETSLYFAIRHRHFETAKWLIEKGADPHAPTITKETLLQIAKKKDRDIYQLLKSKFH